MTEPTPRLSGDLLAETRDYLAHRLDGARDLYLLTLALGDRPDGSPLFGRMIREARIHFAAVIEEGCICRTPRDRCLVATVLGREMTLSNRSQLSNDSFSPTVAEIRPSASPATIDGSQPELSLASFASHR